jgi:hypothetical protein
MAHLGKSSSGHLALHASGHLALAVELPSIIEVTFEGYVRSPGWMGFGGTEYYTFTGGTYACNLYAGNYYYPNYTGGGIYSPWGSILVYPVDGGYEVRIGARPQFGTPQYSYWDRDSLLGSYDYDRSSGSGVDAVTSVSVALPE